MEGITSNFKDIKYKETEEENIEDFYLFCDPYNLYGPIMDNNIIKSNKSKIKEISLLKDEGMFIKIENNDNLNLLVSKEIINKFKDLYEDIKENRKKRKEEKNQELKDKVRNIIKNT